MTISDVARAAGVSPAVVSRVLNEDATLRIAEPTRQRVLTTVADLRYVPRRAARSLRMSIPSAISLMLPDTTSALNAELIRGVEESAQQRDLAVGLLSAEHIATSPDWLDRFVREGRTDGIILQLPTELPVGLLGPLTELPVPMVVINSVDSGPFRTAVLDDQASVRVGVEHLAELGHRNIGYLGGRPGNGTAERRLRGFREAMLDLGLRVRPEWLSPSGFTNEDGRAAARQLLDGRPLPTALVVANVNAAMGFVADARASGLDMPGQLSLICLHDVPFADAVWPSLTTVAVPFRALGAAAVSLLFADDGQEYHQVIRHPAPVLRPRASAVAI